MIKKTTKRKQDEPVSGNKKQKVDLNPTQIYSMLHELLKRSENNCNEAGTSGYDNVEIEDGMEEFTPDDEITYNDQRDLFLLTMTRKLFLMTKVFFQCLKCLKMKLNFVLLFQKVWQSS